MGIGIDIDISIDIGSTFTGALDGGAPFGGAGLLPDIPGIPGIAMPGIPGIDAGFLPLSGFVGFC
jgi:hypothetical protein